jgi:hypothetical protein
VFPVKQESFSPDYRSVCEMLEERLRGCDAVIWLIGRAFGRAPYSSAGQRRSYTQTEYDNARRLGLPVFVYFAPKDLVPDERWVESETDQNLQSSYRAALVSNDQRYQWFSSLHDLKAQVAVTVPMLREIGRRPKLPIQCIQLPKAPLFFVGRELEMDQLDKALQQAAPAVIAVLGFAGQGKTTLAGHWMRTRAENQFSAIFWCTASDAVSFCLYMDDVLRYLLENRTTRSVALGHRARRPLALLGPAHPLHLSRRRMGQTSPKPQSRVPRSSPAKACGYVAGPAGAVRFRRHRQ